jgi:hypothetical protein
MTTSPVSSNVAIDLSWSLFVFEPQASARHDRNQIEIGSISQRIAFAGPSFSIR